MPGFQNVCEAQFFFSYMVWTDSFGFKLQIIAIILAILYFQFKENPALAARDIKVIQHSDVIEEHLNKYKDVIGADFDGYRNHIYRVLTYATHFLDTELKNIDVIGTALVYHDIGLWTAGTLAYLEPGVKLARTRSQAGKYTQEQLDLQDSIITNHHKIWPVQNAREVEAVSLADWIDATNGVFNKGMPTKHIAVVKVAIPTAGFYKTLAEFGPRLHGSNVYSIISQIITIFRW